MLHCLYSIFHFLSKVRSSFNDRAGLYIGPYFFGYNSPAPIVRALFKPFTDTASLLGLIKKNFFWFEWGVRLAGAREVGVFLDFWPTL